MIENLFIHLFNGWCDRRDAQAQARALVAVAAPAPPEEAPPPPGHVLIGRTIPPLGPQGEAMSWPELVALSPQDRLKHVLLCGGTGSGKTNTLLHLIESDISSSRALVCIDLVGDLVDQVLECLARWRRPEDLRGKLFLLDLRDRSVVLPFNPLAGHCAQDEAYARAAHLVEFIRVLSESWGVQLAETSQFGLSALAEAGYSLLEVEPFLTNPGFRAHVMARCTDAYTRSVAARYEALGAGSERQKALWQPVLNKLAPLLGMSDLRLLFGQSGTLPLSLLDAPGAVVLVALDARRLGNAARLVGGMFVSALQGYMTSRGSRPESQRPFLHVALDEFAQMTFASDRFSSLVAEGRRYGVSLSLAHQNAHQLDTGMRHLTRNNIATQLFFATGALDAAEIAREIVLEDKEADARELLLTQQVGQALLVRRGQKAARLQVPRYQHPHVSPQAVEAVRRAAREGFARSRAEVERELAEREAFIASLRPAAQELATARPAVTQNSRGRRESLEAVAPAIPPASGQEVTYEIRHEKPEYFKAAPRTTPETTSRSTPKIPPSAPRSNSPKK